VGLKLGDRGDFKIEFVSNQSYGILFVKNY